MIKNSNYFSLQSEQYIYDLILMLQALLEKMLITIQGP